jgi:hypothetical protein
MGLAITTSSHPDLASNQNPGVGALTYIPAATLLSGMNAHFFHEAKPEVIRISWRREIALSNGIIESFLKLRESLRRVYIS